MKSIKEIKSNQKNWKHRFCFSWVKLCTRAHGESCVHRFLGMHTYL